MLVQSQDEEGLHAGRTKPCRLELQARIVGCVCHPQLGRQGAPITSQSHHSPLLDSTVQVELHPSPDTLLPSSQPSPRSSSALPQKNEAVLYGVPARSAEDKGFATTNAQRPLCRNGRIELGSVSELPHAPRTK